MSELRNSKGRCRIMVQNNRTRKIEEKEGRFGTFYEVCGQARRAGYTLLQYTWLG